MSCWRNFDISRSATITQPRREIGSTGEKRGEESEQDEMSDPRCRDVPVNLMSAKDRLLVAET